MRILTRATTVTFLVFAALFTSHALAQEAPQSTPQGSDFPSLSAQAAAGNAQAQFALANDYFRGVGVPQDYPQALLWFAKSADQGFAPAQNYLGYMYQHKFGVPRDYKRALSYYRSAANQGYALAQYNLGGMFEDGLGVKRDYKQSLDWYYKAADHGSNTAQENIGYMFQNGLGVPTDYAKAMSWFDEAAAHGNSDAENQLGWMYQFGQGVQEDDARAVTWYRMSADLGNRRGAINLDAFKNVLDIRGDGDWDAANNTVTDPAIARAQRWATIDDLQRRIAGLDGDAQDQEDLAYQLEHMGKGKKAGSSKLFNAIGSIPAVKYHAEAAKYRAEAAQLRQQLAQIEHEDPSSASIPAL